MRSVVAEHSIRGHVADRPQEFLQSWVHLRDRVVVRLGEGGFAGTGGTRRLIHRLFPPHLCHGQNLQTISPRWNALLWAEAVTPRPR